MTSTSDYTDIKFEIKGQIGIIKASQYDYIPPLGLNCFLSIHQFSSRLLDECMLTQPPQFNRPKALNSFGGNLIQDTIAALRVLNSHPDTVFTVLTGEGRFFSAGADVRSVSRASGVRRLLLLPLLHNILFDQDC
jgi:peroxisomal 3,2-trans-enoyl-CoA isomerase